MIWSRRGVLVALLLSALVAAEQPPEGSVPEYQLKAEFLERFTRFIDWPGDEAATTPFSICVVGSNPFGGYLTDLASSRKVKGRTIEVKEIGPSDKLEACQILFIASGQKKALERILEKTHGKPVLTVSDSDGFAEKGVVINFYSAESNLRFEINDGAARKSGLKISSKLMKYARVLQLEDGK